MAGERIPAWARVFAVVVATGTALAVIPTVLFAAASLASTVGQFQRTTSVDVGPAPRLQVDAQFGSVAIEAAPDGRIVVEERRAAGSITRAAAAAALRQIAVDVSRQGNLVLVRQAAPVEAAPALDRNSTITIEAPARTDVEVGNVGDLRVQGIEGAVHVHGSGSVHLRDATLLGTSSIDEQFGDLQMTNVTIAGSTAVRKGVGAVTFDGQLVPGGSSLDIESGAGDVRVVLPRPTDARAVITTQGGDFHADGTWLFTPDTPRHWTADLGPNPTGTVTVRAFLGKVTFIAR